ncbi:MAG TPA: hypothetical protein PKA00_01255 [Saprospiraceae bacterium]|nr:hypothetical protein [Saprospiraceae bacterium]HMQ81495.1 hypothetical protein [Saprospiraceae bacterium]
MRLLINLVLIAIIAGLIWVLISSIREPIAFKAEKEKREQAVIAKLRTIRTVQEAYRNITGIFASDFDELSKTLKEGRFAIISVIGDPDDPNFTGEIIYDTTYMSALDSMTALGINLDSLKYVPYGKGVSFDIQADTIDYQKTLVPVVEVGVKRKVFMGKYADARFSRYDNTYDPNSILKFGNLGAPNLSGNWGE